MPIATAFRPAMSGINTLDNTKRSVLTSATGFALGNGPCIRLANTGAAACYIAFGTSAVTATLNDMPILPGSVEVITRPDGATHLSHIGDAATTLFVTIGNGL